MAKQPPKPSKPLQATYTIGEQPVELYGHIETVHADLADEPTPPSLVVNGHGLTKAEIARGWYDADES